MAVKWPQKAMSCAVCDRPCLTSRELLDEFTGIYYQYELPPRNWEPLCNPCWRWAKEIFERRVK